jgi:hypothetical protein
VTLVGHPLSLLSMTRVGHRVRSLTDAPALTMSGLPGDARVPSTDAPALSLFVCIHYGRTSVYAVEAVDAVCAHPCIGSRGSVCTPVYRQ